MKRMVFKVAIQNEKSKQRAMTAVAAVEGVESVATDMAERKITVIGNADPLLVGKKLKKLGFTELLSVCPVKQETPTCVYHRQVNPSNGYLPWPYQGYSSYCCER